MTSLLTEKLSSARLIKTFRLEDYAAAKVDKSFEDVFRLRMKAVRSRGAARSDAGGARRARGRRRRRRSPTGASRSGQSTVGEFIGFVAGLFLMAQPIRGLGNLADARQRGPVRARARLRGARREADDRRQARRQAAGASATATIRFEDVGFAYPERRGRAGGARLHARRAGRQDRRAGRPLGRRQIDDHQSRAAAVRRHRRAHPDRRPGHPRRHARPPARRDLDRQPGRDAVRRHHPRQHRARPARRQRGRHRRRRQGRRRARLHPGPAQGLRHR